jgi:hypothetical protein
MDSTRTRTHTRTHTKAMDTPLNYVVPPDVMVKTCLPTGTYSMPNLVKELMVFPVGFIVSSLILQHFCVYKRVINESLVLNNCL